MSQRWPLHLTVDAYGSEDSFVRARRLRPGDDAAYLTVRVGSVLVYCLDANAVTTMAGAWARAYASSAELLPLTSSQPRPLAPNTGYGAPVAQVVAEGAQRWDVTPPRRGSPFVEVSSRWLTVRVHDATALRTHTHAWALACDLGQQALPRPPATFHRLMQLATNQEMVNRYRDAHPGAGR